LYTNNSPERFSQNAIDKQTSTRASARDSSFIDKTCSAMIICRFSAYVAARHRYFSLLSLSLSLSLFIYAPSRFPTSVTLGNLAVLKIIAALALAVGFAKF
jgi:hypothetical protein